MRNQDELLSSIFLTPICLVRLFRDEHLSHVLGRNPEKRDQILNSLETAIPFFMYGGRKDELLMILKLLTSITIAEMPSTRELTLSEHFNRVIDLFSIGDSLQVELGARDHWLHTILVYFVIHLLAEVDIEKGFPPGQREISHHRTHASSGRNYR